MAYTSRCSTDIPFTALVRPSSDEIDDREAALRLLGPKKAPPPTYVYVQNSPDSDKKYEVKKCHCCFRPGNLFPSLHLSRPRPETNGCPQVVGWPGLGEDRFPATQTPPLPFPHDQGRSRKTARTRFSAPCFFCDSLSNQGLFCPFPCAFRHLLYSEHSCGAEDNSSHPVVGRQSRAAWTIIRYLAVRVTPAGFHTHSHFGIPRPGAGRPA